MTMKFLKRILMPDYGLPPLPNETEVPQFDGEAVIELIYSDKRERRVFILQDKNRIFRSYVQWWDTSDWDAGYGAHWTGGYGSSLTDSLERARELANEQLRIAP